MSVGNVAGIPPQHPLQLLLRQPAPNQPPRVHLDAVDERLAEVPVQPGAAVVRTVSNAPVWITHGDEGNAPVPCGVMPSRPVNATRGRPSAHLSVPFA